MDHLREYIHSRILELRRVSNILCNPLIQALWDKSSDCQKTVLTFHIQNCNIRQIREWIKNNKEIEEMGFRELQSLAKDLKITNYSRLNKIELIKEIMKHEKDGDVR